MAGLPVYCTVIICFEYCLKDETTDKTSWGSSRGPFFCRTSGTLPSLLSGSAICFSMLFDEWSKRWIYRNKVHPTRGDKCVPTNCWFPSSTYIYILSMSEICSERAIGVCFFFCVCLLHLPYTILPRRWNNNDFTTRHDHRFLFIDESAEMRFL